MSSAVICTESISNVIIPRVPQLRPLPSRFAKNRTDETLSVHPICPVFELAPYCYSATAQPSSSTGSPGGSVISRRHMSLGAPAQAK